MTIEGWRLNPHDGRPVRQFNGSEMRDRNPRLPEMLFRQIPVADLFLIFRDKELPLQHFKGGGTDSSVDPNSVGNFWFTEPVSLNYVDGYIITEPAQWKTKPVFVQESNMSFKSEISAGEIGGEWASWNPEHIRKDVPEIHTGNRLTTDELTVCISENLRRQMQEEYEILNNYANLTDEDKQKVFRRIGETIEREFGENPVPKEMTNLSQNSKKSFLGKKTLDDPNEIKIWQNFYQWVLNLPVIPRESSPADVDEVVHSQYVRKNNTERFLSFYNKLKKDIEEKPVVDEP